MVTKKQEKILNAIMGCYAKNTIVTSSDIKIATGGYAQSDLNKLVKNKYVAKNKMTKADIATVGGKCKYKYQTI